MDSPRQARRGRRYSQIVGFNFHRGVLACGRKLPAAAPEALLRQACPANGASTVVLCENVNNLDNVGAVFRNAAAFGCKAVVFDATSADPCAAEWNSLVAGLGDRPLDRLRGISAPAAAASPRPVSAESPRRQPRTTRLLWYVERTTPAKIRGPNRRYYRKSIRVSGGHALAVPSTRRGSVEDAIAAAKATGHVACALVTPETSAREKAGRSAAGLGVLDARRGARRLGRLRLGDVRAERGLLVLARREDAEDERGDHERTRASIAETRQKLDSARLSLSDVDIILNQALQEIIAAPGGPGDANHRQQLMVKTAVDAVVDARRSVRKISNESAM